MRIVRETKSTLMEIRCSYFLLTCILGSVSGYGHHRLQSSLGGNQIDPCGSHYRPRKDPFQICAINSALQQVQTFSSGTEMRNWNRLYCNATNVSNYFVKMFNGPCPSLSALGSNTTGTTFVSPAGSGTAATARNTTSSVTPNITNSTLK